MKVFWKNPEKTILIREFSKDWDWEAYRESVNQMRRMLQEVRHGVCVIIDCREMGLIPLGALGHFSEGNRNLPSNVSVRVLVSENKLSQAFMAILRRTAPHNFENFYIVSTMEAAIAKTIECQKSSNS